MLIKSQVEKYEKELVLLCRSQDWERVISMFESSMLNLRKSGDYPEAISDQVIKTKLVDILYFVKGIKSLGEMKIQ